MDVRIRPAALGAGLVASALVLSACTGEEPAPGTSGAAGTSSPALSPSPDPTASAEAAAAEDAAQLPMRPEEIGAWAESVLPEDAGRGSGWLSERTSPVLTISDGTLAAGTYAMRFVCNGRGAITVTFEASGVDGPGEQLAGAPTERCEGSTVSLTVTTPERGLTTRLHLDGAPTVYAYSLQESAGAE